MDSSRRLSFSLRTNLAPAWYHARYVGSLLLHSFFVLVLVVYARYRKRVRLSGSVVPSMALPYHDIEIRR